MSEKISEDLQAKATKAFLSWVKEAVEAGHPVVIREANNETLSPQLEKIATPLKFSGLSEEEILELARSGESAARFDKALREKADADRLDKLQADYKEHWNKFRGDRQVLSAKYGLNDQQMLSIFQELTRAT